MIVSTTFVPCECAVESNPLSWLEFQTEAPWSAANVPLPCTCKPKNATVLSSEKFQDGYPTEGSASELARPKPKISRTGPPAPPTAAWGATGVNGASEVEADRDICPAACCMTTGCVGSGLGAGPAAAAALPGTKARSTVAIRSAGK